MKKISNMTMNGMRKQTNNFANSIRKDSEMARKQVVVNSKALTELNKKGKKSKKKTKKNDATIVEKQEVQEVKVHPSFLALFWISITIAFIATLLGF